MSYDIKARLSELEGKIVTICVGCPHAKFQAGSWNCKVRRSHCHSKRVHSYLKEIKRLEEEELSE